MESKSRINTFQQLQSEFTWTDSIISANIHTQLKRALKYSLFANKNIYFMFRIEYQSLFTQS